MFAGTHGDADCHIFGVGDFGACGDKVTQADLNVDCRYKNGQPPQKPCITATKNMVCGKCFKVTIKEPGSGGPVQNACSGAGCPAYERTIMIKTIDSTGKADFEIAQNGWSGTTGLCPGVCAATSYCSETPAPCVHKWIPDSGVMKSGCYSNSKDIAYEEVSCP